MQDAINILNEPSNQATCFETFSHVRREFELRLTPEQQRELIRKKEVKIEDITHNGKKCNAIVKIEDGFIKKKFVSATLKQQQKPSATTTKRKTQPSKKGMRM